jgi:hypothetical protein
MTAVILRTRASSDVPHHATAEEYAAFLRRLPRCEGYKRQLLLQRARFVEAYPDLARGQMGPLADRVGIASFGSRPEAHHPAVQARMYLMFLCIRDFMKLDWDWALATRKLEIGPFLRDAGVDLEIDYLLGIAHRLGYKVHSSRSRAFAGS